MAADLNDDELDELQALLADLPEPLQPLDVVAAEGYLCGVLVQPRRIATDEWLPGVIDVDRRSPDAADPAALARLRELLERRFAALNETLADGGFDPLMAEPDDDVPDDEAEADPAWAALPVWSRTVAPWSAGFEHALALFPDLDDWADEDVATAVATVLRHLPPDDDADAAPAMAELSSLDDALDELVETVAWLWDVSAEERYRVEPVRRDAPKVGRNDPCPCGSGRKFKLCHGA